MKFLDSKKKKILAAALALVLVCGLGFGAYALFSGGSKEAVYVTPVSIGEDAHYGSVNRFSGVVQPQATIEINPDGNKTVGEVYVSAGDSVKAGDKLFSYDTASLQLDLLQLQVDVQRIKNEIESNNNQIAQLKAEKEHAPADQQLEYSLNIQQLQNATQSLQFSLKVKNNEVTSLQSVLKNADVTSPVDGTVKAVKSDNNQYSDGAFITITESGDYLVCATINELNVRDIYEGMSVVVRSRIDDTVWYGTIDRVDLSSTVQNSSYYYYFGGSGDDQSSKYHFYVSLINGDGLFIGQHVVVEPSFGDAAASGLLLSEMYICDLAGNPFVWKDKNGRLVKQKVEIGGYNEFTGEYEILSGLTSGDYIAFPTEELREGMKTTTEYTDFDDSFVDDFGNLE